MLLIHIPWLQFGTWACALSHFCERTPFVELMLFRKFNNACSAWGVDPKYFISLFYTIKLLVEIFYFLVLCSYSHILPSLLLPSLPMSTSSFPCLFSYCHRALGSQYALLEVYDGHVWTISTIVGHTFLQLVLTLVYLVSSLWTQSFLRISPTYPYLNSTLRTVQSTMQNSAFR